MKFDSKRIMAMIVAASILMVALACAVDETQGTPLLSGNDSVVTAPPDEGTVPKTVAPISAADDFSITQTKLISTPKTSEAAEPITEPASVSVVSKLESPGTGKPPVAYEPSAVTSSVARETPAGQPRLSVPEVPANVETEVEGAVAEQTVDRTPELAVIQPSATPEPAISESESVKQDVTENKTVALTIPQVQGQLEPVEPEQEPTPPPLQTPTVTPEPTPTSTPVPEPELPTPELLTPEPVTAAVEPTPIPVTFGTEVGDIAHPFRLPSVDGPEYRLEDQKGRSVVLIFYRAYW